MTEFENWPVWLKWIMLACPFVIGLAGCAISAFIACTRNFTVATSAIQSNPGLEQMKLFLGTRRFRARWLLITFLCGILIWPGIHMRRGHLDIEEFENFPAKIKLALQISSWLTAFGFAWMWVTYAFIKA
ncbi:hypothetical protein IYR97_19250 [Pseudomonas fulva]|uniref:Uncharacterized protein n=1 Tax=Pseudomonas fulva TaxID=47880 RepID=A0A7S9L6Y0_9PSED|nr:hypothetical protein [Pseudomonas fulva]QPH43414.1 hypothetical protein IYR97_19250 [Pseudomonas fulva]QPH48492.1 hypothetical protein IZU98_19215 [Pseudomonas fulva]